MLHLDPDNPNPEPYKAPRYEPKSVKVSPSTSWRSIIVETIFVLATAEIVLGALTLTFYSI